MPTFAKTLSPMKIGLLDVDGRNFPNLALMKLAAYHKSHGDNVSWLNPASHYDIVYKSKVFTFTPDETPLFSASLIIKGGTGYNISTNLQPHVDALQPDYSIYPQFPQAYGFLTRGCPNKCSWCIVPQKEGVLVPYMDIQDIAQDRKVVILMDNNVLASDYGLAQIEKAITLNLKLDFNQGLDARIIADNLPIAKLLAKVKWYKPLRLALDSPAMVDPLIKAVISLRSLNCTPKDYSVYVLIRDLPSAYAHINLCKALKLSPFAQPYRDFSPNQIIPQWQRDLARYTNAKPLLNSTDFKTFSPRKNVLGIHHFPPPVRTT